MLGLMIPVMFDHLGQGRYRQRLAQHIVHTRFKILFLVFQDISCQRNQRRQGAARITLAQLTGDIQPAHVRQLNIQQGQIELVRVEHR
ncbi:hypothetical protein D3C75_957670 [compost metagenome]